MGVVLRAVATCVLIISVVTLLPTGNTARASGTATLTGMVADSAGRPLKGAQVTLSGNGVTTVSALTTDRGGYRFPALRPFTVYTISAEHPQYRVIEYDGMRTEPGRTRRVDFRLKRFDEQEVVVLLTRDHFPHEEMVEAFIGQIDVPVRVIDLDDAYDPAEAVRRVRAEKPNVILGAGLTAARLIRREIGDIPSILTLVDEPRKHDLKAVNLCFVSHHPETRDVLDRILAILPEAKRIGLIYDATMSALFARDLRVEAKARGLKVALGPCYDRGDIRGRLKEFHGKIDVLVVPYDPVTVSPSAVKRITRWALTNRVPLAAPNPSWVRGGALFSYGIPLDQLGREASGIATWILREHRPPDDFGKHIIRPSVHVLAVNHETAITLDVKVPSDLTIDEAY